jgi:hypothetical protein
MADNHSNTSFERGFLPSKFLRKIDQGFFDNTLAISQEITFKLLRKIFPG